MFYFVFILTDLKSEFCDVITYLFFCSLICRLILHIILTGQKIINSYKTFSDSAKLLLYEYNALENPDLKDILLFHSKFEKKSPLILEDQRIGKLLVFKECLKNNIKPFVIEHDVSKD